MVFQWCAVDCNLVTFGGRVADDLCRTTRELHLDDAAENVEKGSICRTVAEPKVTEQHSRFMTGNSPPLIKGGAMGGTGPTVELGGEEIAGLKGKQAC